METRRKNRVRCERPKIRRVYVSLVNPDDPNEREYFTAYETDVRDLKQRITGERSKSAEPSAA